MTPDQLLAALQFGDSLFPSGMFTQSHGLESFVAAGVAGEALLGPLLRSYLIHAAGPGEALAARWVARAAHQGDIDLVMAVDRRLDATRLSAEGRLASRRCGGRMLLLGAELYPASHTPAYAARVQSGVAPGHQAIALALLAEAAGLDEHAAVLVELYSYAASLVSAAVRLGALDHIGAQRLLVELRTPMAQAANATERRHWRTIGGFAPEIELMQMRHAWGEMHLFVS